MAKSSTLSPIDDLTYDVIAVLHKKAQALDAYEKYIGDAQAEDDCELEDLFVQMRKHDEDTVLALKEILAHRLEEDLEYDEVEDEDDRDTVYDDIVEGDEVEQTPSERNPPVHGESDQRQR